MVKWTTKCNMWSLRSEYEVCCFSKLKADFEHFGVVFEHFSHFLRCHKVSYRHLHKKNIFNWNLIWPLVLNHENELFQSLDFFIWGPLLSLEDVFFNLKNNVRWKKSDKKYRGSDPLKKHPCGTFGTLNQLMSIWIDYFRIPLKYTEGTAKLKVILDKTLNRYVHFSKWRPFTLPDFDVSVFHCKLNIFSRNFGKLKKIKSTFRIPNLILHRHNIDPTFSSVYRGKHNKVDHKSA